jgi:hypothetical protein
MTYYSSFGIDTAKDFYEEIVKPSYKEFLQENSSRRRAIIAIILAYHQYDWTIGKQFGSKTACKDAQMDSALAVIFDVARRITNCSKHSGGSQSNRIPTSKQLGFSSAYDSSFAKPLVIEMDDGTKLSADQMLKAMMSFWEMHPDLQ